MADIFSPLLSRFLKLQKMQRFFIGEGPSRNSVLLRQRQVFILPTREGYLFAIVLFMMLVGSINYANSLGFILTFFLVSLSIIGILHTYKNLLHLKISVAQIKPTFSGDLATIPVIIDNTQHHERQAVGIGFPKQEVSYCDIPANDWISIEISQVARSRGRHIIEPFSLRTKFPLGIFTSWSHVRLSNTTLVYPKPKGSKQLPYGRLHQPEQMGVKGRDGDDFVGFRHYQHGDSLRQINWKAIAREQGLYTKQFGGGHGVELWLDWGDLTHLDSEARLSQLCLWVLLADADEVSYGLCLPDKKINPSVGQAHRHHCLESLALYKI
jgi:uncharacterized protein (DUF58 family)